MKHYLLNHQPQKGLQAACAQQGQAPTCNARGKGRTSASPKTLTKIILVLLTMILLPSAAWGQGTQNYYLVVGGNKDALDSKEYTISASTNGITLPEDGSVSFSYNTENSTGTLTLKNATITNFGDYQQALIISDQVGKLIIDLQGQNSITNDLKDCVLSSNSVTTVEFTSTTQDGSLLLEITDQDANLGVIGALVTIDSYKNGLEPRIITYTYEPPSLTNATKAVIAIPYGISIAGVEVTSANNTNILNDANKTVSFTPANATTSPATPATLTLNGASISGGGIYTTLESLEIDLKNTNTIETGSGTTGQGTSTRNGIMSTKNGTLTFVTASGGSLEITSTASAIKGFQTINGYLETHVPYTIKSKNDNYPNQDLYRTCEIEGDSVAITWMKISDLETYPLWIGDYQVNANNKDHILGSGNTTVTFSPTSSPATLTLNNANYGPSVKGIVWSGGGNLKIQFSGNNIINTYNGGELNAGEGYCILGNSSSDLILSASDNARTLTLKPNSGDTPESYYSKAAISGFTNVSLDDSWGMYYTKNCAPASASSLTAGEEVIIIKGTPLGISVAGVVVTSENQTNILGDGKVSFSPAEVVSDQPSTGSDTHATLTLNGAMINGPITSSIGDLHVHLIGSNTISGISSDNNPFQYTGNLDTSILTFESEEEDAGELTMTGIEGMEDIATHSKVQNIGNNGTSETFTFYDSENGYNGWIKGVYSTLEPKEVVLYRNISYNLWAISESGSETRYTKNNKTSIEGAPSYDPENHALDVSAHTYSIKSSLPELILLLSGQECKLPKVTFAPIEGVQESGTLTISKKSDSGSEQFAITLGNDKGTDPVISGFSSISHTGFTFLKDGSEYDTNSKKLVDANGDAVTSIDLKYNVTLSNVPNITRNFETGALEITNSNSYEFTTTKYSIIYADGSDGVTDATYSSTEAPVLDKPATVTAYEQLNEVKSEVAKAKYFGLKKETVTMAVGDNYTSENPLDILTPAIEEGDGIYYSFSTDNVDIINCEDNGLKAVASGTAQAVVIIEQEDNSSNSGVSVLSSNESLLLTVNVGAPLNEVFKGSNEFGSFYNTSETTYAVPEGMKAYVITGADPKTGKVTTAETTVLPPNTPVLLEKGSAKAFTYIPAISGTAPSGNLLKRATSDVAVNTSSKLFVLYNDEYVKATADSPIPAGKNYLDLSGVPAAGTRGFYDIDGGDGTTAIKDVKSGEVDGEKWADGGWHDLQGRRLSAKPTKPGLYILNGKKVVIK